MQVAPAELEAYLLTHPYVSDCAVIQTHHKRSGEVPKAFIVRSKESLGKTESEMAQAICEHVEKHKAKEGHVISHMIVLFMDNLCAQSRDTRRSIHSIKRRSIRPHWRKTREPSMVPVKWFIGLSVTAHIRRMREGACGLACQRKEGG
ncbi:phenylacetyl-CoA ligase [Ilyonectria robusta]